MATVTRFVYSCETTRYHAVSGSLFSMDR